jgi:hypothetical protein
VAAPEVFSNSMCFSLFSLSPPGEPKEIGNEQRKNKGFGLLDQGKKTLWASLAIYIHIG